MENSQIIKWNLSEEGARTFFRLLFHNFFHKFFWYFLQCIFLCKKFLKNSQFFCIAQRFSPKKVKYFQDFFPTVNNTVKFGGIFCTAYIFSNISGKTYREIGGKNFWNFWVANIVVNFCSIFCTVFAVFFAFLILLQNFQTKKLDFLLWIILQIFSQKSAHIFAYIFSDLKYYSKNCRFLCFAYI